MLLPPAATASAPPQPKRVRSKPNVVLITIDTLRADHLGCYGNKGVRTPNIDAVAADGTRMQRAYTPVPITLPSHTVMMTGTYPMKSGMHDFSGNTLSPEQPTLASVLKSNGYQTGAVVASAVLDSRFGLNHGFDFYYDHFDFNRLLETNLDAMERPGNVVADQALAWLGEHGRKPFFLWMHLYDPHYPYTPPSPYAEQYKSHPYDGEIAFADAQVGRVIQLLKKSGLYDQTLVVIAGDHGEGLGEHGEKTHGFFIYNSTLHVPLIFKFPAETSIPRIAGTAVSLVDLMPTVLDVVGIDIPHDVQGHSLLPLLAQKATPVTSPVYAESFLPRLHFNWSELRGLEAENYHYIDGPKPELYDLGTDPGEVHNLYSDKRPLAETMQSKLQGVMSTYTPGQEMARKQGLDPAVAERLQALGYAAFSGGSDKLADHKNLADPKDRIAFYESFSEAMDDSQHGHYDESIRKLAALLTAEPHSIPARYLLGLNYYKSRQFADAARTFSQVVQDSPEYALANYYLGLSLARSGDMPGAIAAFNKTLQLDATNFSAAFNLGAALLKEGRAGDALAAFRRAVEINPDYAEGHRAIGQVLLYQNDADGALVELRRAVELSPNDPQCRFALAKALEAKGMSAEAREQLRKAQANSAQPDHP